MDAKQIFNRRIAYGDGKLADIVVWEVPKPVLGSLHRFKYRLAYVVNGVCVLRYDNEAGKGDHKHFGEAESSYVFSCTGQLLRDFFQDIERWNDENGYL